MPKSFSHGRLLAVFTLATLAVAFPGAAGAQEPPAPKSKWTVIAECQMVVMPQKAALSLIPVLSDEKKVEGEWAKVQEMIDRGEATLIANLLVQGEAGKNLVTESVEELRYATEYDPPKLPREMPKENATEFLKNWPVAAITPTAFETRNLGVTLEVKAEVSADGQWIRAQVVPNHVRLLRFSKFEAGTLPTGKELFVEQPQFSTLKDTLSLVVRSGQRVLVGVHKVPGSENTMELFILRMRTQPIENPP